VYSIYRWNTWDTPKGDKDMKIKKLRVGHRKTRTTEYEYKIMDDAGRTLTYRAGAVMFNTEAKAQEFINNVENGTKILNDEYRWF
jgi:hypothetical protein